MLAINLEDARGQGRREHMMREFEKVSWQRRSDRMQMWETRAMEDHCLKSDFWLLISDRTQMDRNGTLLDWINEMFCKATALKRGVLPLLRHRLLAYRLKPGAAETDVINVRFIVASPKHQAIPWH